MPLMHPDADEGADMGAGLGGQPCERERRGAGGRHEALAVHPDRPAGRAALPGCRLLLTRATARRRCRQSRGPPSGQSSPAREALGFQIKSAWRPIHCKLARVLHATSHYRNLGPSADACETCSDAAYLNDSIRCVGAGSRSTAELQAINALAKRNAVVLANLRFRVLGSVTAGLTQPII